MHSRLTVRALAKQISTMGPIGYLPAPGTMATLATIPIVMLMHGMMTCTGYLMVVGLSSIGAYVVIREALPCFAGNDPSEIVIDEFVGCLITYSILPINWNSLFLGFILFRFFDIVKCCGIKSLERLGGAWGVLADDMLAGFFACMGTSIILFLHTFLR